MPRLRRLGPLACLLLLAPLAHASEGGGGESLGKILPLWTVLPFVALLLCIALLPLFAGHWWEKNRNRAIVSFGFAIPVVVYKLAVHGSAGGQELMHKVHEYVSFVTLLASLFVITGGIYIRGSLKATPRLNTGIMAIGAVLANVIGTTGASVLLIRPLLRANAGRPRRAHVIIFFIFTVANCGGLLTPLGDPPLFLGYLKGVPFEWTARLWKEWATVNAIVLLVFYVWDRFLAGREDVGAMPETPPSPEPLGIDGGKNFLFLLGIVGAIYAAGAGLLNGGQPWPFGVQELLMGAIAAGAWFTTPRTNRERNRFTFGPILEVAILFAGIFITMAPALLVLNAWGQGQREVLGMAFGMRSPAAFFWGTGALSSFLDNAPTYLTFASTACGIEHIPGEGRYLDVLLDTAHGHVLGPRLLEAISCGAVFMGANTYIGNGPNFMVKAIAEENGVEMPGFFGYMVYSGMILLPAFGIVTLIFFAH
ncbi:MAG TPA: sodium:proton antiporter [Planctomycetota bacterium]|nr:sodium:proton antiporter [Planctomycetota bacterium]